VVELRNDERGAEVTMRLPMLEKTPS